MEAQSTRRRQQDYADIAPDRPLVIDNGSYCCRVGWAGEQDPRIIFRSIVNRPRHKATGDVVNLVGDCEPEIIKFFDFTRSSLRSAFDGNVVYQFETMECILDYALDKMGVEGPEVSHPILMTECPCNPIYSRSKMAELLFEAYGIPSLAFGIDGIFSYIHNQRNGICKGDGLLLSSGFTTTHVIPMARGEPVMEAMCRTSIAGFHVTDYLRRLLSLQYPHHVNSITWDKVEELKQEYCYIAENYNDELQIFQEGGQNAIEKTRWWQLPWVPPPEKDPISEEQLARKAAVKEKQTQRLREMAAAKRSSRIADLEVEVQTLQQILEDVEGLDDEQAEISLSETGYSSRQDIQGALFKATAALRKAKGESIEPEKENVDIPSEKFPLVDIPDHLLTEDQLKEKRKQRFLKFTSEGRARAKQKRQEQNLQREREQKVEEEKRMANPEQYLEELRLRHADLAAKVEQRKRQKVALTNGTGTSSTTSSVTAGGRSERLSASQKERMKLLTKVAFDRGKEEDTFGMRDEDWQLYKQMDKDNDDEDDADDDEAELGRLNSRLKEIDPSFIMTASASISQEAVLDVHVQRPLTEEDFRIVIGTERFRCPEVLFQPSMVGVDQAGIGELVSISLRRLPETLYEQVSNGPIFLTGGNCYLNGLDARLHAEIKQCRPLGSVIKITRAIDPSLDAWHGASIYAASDLFKICAFTKADYEEKGQDWLRQYKLTYSLR